MLFNQERIAWLAQKRKYLVTLLVVCLVSLGWLVWHQGAEVTEQTLQEALTGSANAKSYSFTVQATMNAGGKQRVLSQVQGEKNGAKYHILGEMLKTPVEAYLMKGKLYVKDPFGEWLVLEETDQERAEMYIGELNPLAVLNIKHIGEVKQIKADRIKGERVYRFALQPDLNYPELEVMWTDFTANIWIDPGEKLIRKTQIKAVNKANPRDTLEVIVLFDEYGKDFPITAPVKSEN